MCARCQELEEEVRFLKRELGLDVERDKVGRLQTSLAITPHQARILYALYVARGRIITFDILHEMIPAEDGAPRDSVEVFKVQICKMRRAVGSNAIQNVWGKGYRITHLGQMVVEDALEATRRAA